MDSGSIELKVISARDLKCFNFFRKLYVYAVVSLRCDETKKKQEKKYLQRQKTLVNDESKKQNLQRKKSFVDDESKKLERKRLQRQKTPVDREGDGNPEWHHEMHFDLKEISVLDDDCKQNLFLKFDLRSEGIVLGKKTIGEVQVSVKDLIDDELNGTARIMSYQVRTSDGKPNGVLKFSYKVKNCKTKQKRVETESPKVDSSSGIQLSDAKKVNYPTLEVENQQSRDIGYPSLDDVRSDLPRMTIPSPKKYHWMPGPYILAPPAMLPHLPPPWEQPAYYNPLPSMQIPGTYRNNPERIMGYGYTLTPGVWGYSGVGQ
ncbi:hypothetical protein I3843_05G089800 [Carya illinoinensis]|uniref:C2 domain-containing protein n=1 Tax=Carya illinoinensis TaxID=32201 RepID=A0A8T1QGF2_CARIL|nr:uncharacterized protein LOC122310903 [Carya illinoinensis]KAG2706367.1 hypothetical protein I3760_05G100600 [Carya illinoinensis]KAG6653760.1 hypothetical protein CIPAW_05G098600 [Carya illinoinensis]KAG6712304.1 hypothetical protein I3842_05G096900 [Carya illinoinensis]KAG7978588.1 hypothetical protein I3843_05G089800 [Carya illinoinensis]